VRGGRKVTRLPNGTRVVSWGGTRALSAVGVFMILGTRSESDETNGCSAIYDRYLFSSNRKISRDVLAEDFAHLGNSIAVSNHRECVSYIAQCPSYYVPQAVDVLSGALLFPDFHDQEMFTFVKNSMIDSIPKRGRDPTKYCFELMHQAAYGRRTLGRSAFFDEHNIRSITPALMDSFVKQQIRPEQTVVAASSVADHEAFVECVRQCFVFPVTAETRSVKEASTFVGGVEMLHNIQPPESVEKFEEKNLTHIALFMSAPTGQSKDFYTVAVIQCLLGGGQAFSSGGPGKGMLTKLYREVIHKEGWVSSVECITASYTDSGMLGLYGTAPHDFNQHLMHVLMHQIATIPYRIDTYHIEMAKQHLLSQLYLVNDTMAVQMEDTGRTLLLFDTAVSYSEAIQLVNTVTMEDIQRVCDTMMRHKMAIGVYGNTSGIGSSEQIHSRIQTIAARKR